MLKAEGKRPSGLRNEEAQGAKKRAQVQDGQVNRPHGTVVVTPTQ